MNNTTTNDPILSGNEARTAMVNGVDKLANAVKVTLGPAGRTVILADKQIPTVTKDGVSVARSVNLADKWENYSAQLVKNVATRAEKTAGDGTTTATVLAQALINYGINQVNSGKRPVNVVTLLNQFVVDAKDAVSHLRDDVTNYNELLNVATISANGDVAMATIVADTISAVGNYGMVNAKNGIEDTDTYDISTGYVIPRGLSVSGFANAGNSFKATDASVLLINDVLEVTDDVDMLGRLLAVRATNEPLLIICNEFDDSVCNRLIANVIRPRNLRVAMVRAPFAGKSQLEVMTDIGKLVSCKLWTNEDIRKEYNTAKKVDTANPNNQEVLVPINPKFGKVKSVVCDDHTTVLDYHDIDLSDYVDELQQQVKNSRNGHSKERIIERIARLVGGVANIYVGGSTEAELQERKHRFEDAIRATQAAALYGTVVGGGYTLLDVSYQLESLFPAELCNVLRTPIIQIFNNAEYTVTDTNKAIELREPNANNDIDTETYTDVLSGKTVNLANYMVNDPYLVTITALDTALSIAKLVITTEVIIGSMDNPNRSSNIPHM